jgi:hypothetical protein
MPAEAYSDMHIAERLSLRSGLPFAQAKAACKAIQACMMQAFAKKATEVRRRPQYKEGSRMNNAAIFYKGFGEFKLVKNRSPHGEFFSINFHIASAFDTKLNPNNPMFKHTRNKETNKKRKHGHYA